MTNVATTPTQSPPEPRRPSKLSAISLHSISSPAHAEKVVECSNVQKDEFQEPEVDDIEHSQDAAPSVILRTANRQKWWGHVQFASLCWCMFLAGWNDSSPGPLLPRIQEVYHIGFFIVSLIWVFACIGFLIGACINVPLNDKAGFGKTIALGSICQVVAYAIQAAGPRQFPVFVLSYPINGIGMALQDAQANGFVASLKDNANTKMSLLHAAYGVGALISPLSATQFAQLHHWSFHYLISLGIAFLNTVFLIAVFKLKLQDECLAQIGQEPGGEVGSSEHGTFRQILDLKAMHLLAVFILIYVGVEVTVGGWIVTYIINVRKGGPSAGYISTGFYAGMTVGRTALIWLNNFVGERRILFLYSILAIILELIVWFVPSLIGDAVAISFVGVLLGPFYPIAMNHSSRILPPWLLTGAIGWIAGFGQAGTALIPFMTGAIASRAGISSLQPILVAMMAFMFVLWALVPNHRPGTEDANDRIFPRRWFRRRRASDEG